MFQDDKTKLRNNIKEQIRDGAGIDMWHLADLLSDFQLRIERIEAALGAMTETFSKADENDY